MTQDGKENGFRKSKNLKRKTVLSPRLSERFNTYDLKKIKVL